MGGRFKLQPDAHAFLAYENQCGYMGTTSDQDSLESEQRKVSRHYSEGSVWGCQDNPVMENHWHV